MTDERFEEFLRAEARQFNEPPETPLSLNTRLCVLPLPALNLLCM